MAKRGVNLQPIRDKFYGIQKVIKVSNEELKNIAESAAQTARDTIIIGSGGGLGGPDGFTQKHGEELANWITVTKDGNTYTLAAGEGAPEEIKYELYFAEFGAGINADEKAMGQRAGSQYIEKPMHKIHNGGPWDGYWTYPLIEPVMVQGKDGNPKSVNYGLANQSVPLYYMEEARNSARFQIGTLAGRLKTNIRRVWGGKTTINIGGK